MFKHWRLLAAATFAMATGQASAATYNWTQLGNTLDSFVSSSRTPPTGSVSSYTFVLYDKNGGVLYQRAGGRNTTMTTSFPLASTSKLPAVAAILTLVDSGKIGLDTPVAKYLKNSAVTWPADKSAITMRMLLDHTSGLPGLTDNYPSCIDNESSSTLAQCVQIVANVPLLYKPGSTFDYGGADYQVAGYVAQVVSGRSSWQAFFNAAIATPMGLKYLTYGSPTKFTNPRIAGGANSDAPDYSSLLQMVLNNGSYNGKQILKATTVANDLETNQIAGLPIEGFPPILPPAAFPGYTMGLFTSAAWVFVPSPGPEYSDPGTTGPTPWFDTGLGYAAVILIDQDSQTGYNMWNAVRPLVIQQLMAAAPR
jgi:CubicO group peptidase (beta-lactamase class C family)